MKASSHVYGTQLLNDCPQELWEQLDADAIAKEMEAVLVKLNGPRYWMIDGLGSKAKPIEPVMREFGGIVMRRIAMSAWGTSHADALHGPLRRSPSRLLLDAGSRVFELVDPKGSVYVMQARCVGVDPGMSEEALVTLGDRLALPESWTYRTRILDEERWWTRPTTWPPWSRTSSRTVLAARLRSAPAGLDSARRLARWAAQLPAHSSRCHAPGGR